MIRWREEHGFLMNDINSVPSEPALLGTGGFPPAEKRRVPRWARIGVMVAVYFCAATMSLWLTEDRNLEASYWLPGGLVLGLLLITPPREWWTVLVAMFAGDLLYNVTGAAWPFGYWFIVTVGNALTALLGAWLVRRLATPRPEIRTVGELAGIVGLGAASLVVTATIGAWTIQQLGDQTSFSGIWASWFSSDLLGIILVTPLILVWRGASSQQVFFRWSKRHLEAAILAAALMGSVIAVVSIDSLRVLPLRYPVVPFVIWAAVRFGPRGVTMVSLVAAILVGWFAMSGHGGLLFSLPTTHERNVQLQLALGFIGFFGLVPAIVIETLRRTEAELREQRNFLKAIFDSELECVKVIGLDGKLVQMNGAGLAMLEVESVEEARAHGVLNFVQADFRERFVALTRKALAGEPGSLIFPIKGHKGTVRWLETHATGLRDGAGQVISLLGVTRDVSARRQAEEALQRARFTVDRATIAIFWVRRDASIADANAAACGLLGYSLDEMTRLRLPDFDPEYCEERWPQHWEALKGRQSISFASRLRRKDGSAIDVIISDHRLSFGGEELNCAFVQDVSERRQAELRIENLNQRLALAVQGAGYGVWEFGVDTGKLFWDERMYAVYGHTRATFDGSADAWQACLHPDSRALVAERFAALMAGRPAGDFEFRIIRASDGAERVIEANGFLQRDAEGRPQRLVGMNRDVTEQKQAGEARRKSEEQLKSIFSAVSEGIVVLDRKLRVIQTNAAAERILGLPANYLMGRTADERLAREVREDGSLFTPEDLPSAVALRTGRPVRDVVMGVHRPDGGLAWICVNVEPLLDPQGEVTMVVTSFSDITASRALQEQVRQAQKMEVVGQLAGGVAHDFNNILTAMTLNLQIIEMDRQLPDELKPQLADLEAMTRRAAKLTEQLLLFARRRVMQTQPLEFNSGLASVLKLLRRLLGEHVAVNLSLSAEALWISADAGMLDQVVMNLCVNARDAMPAGGVLTIETALVEVGVTTAQPEARPGRYARLRVTDTGTGITPEVRAHLFEPFFTTKEVGQGTGLGLATVHGIIHQHQGWIEVESVVGQGSTFVVYLPITQPAEMVRVKPAGGEIRGGTETILLVEDEVAVRQVAGIVLRKLGYRVIEAANGPEALAIWAQQGKEIDLLITDMVMPHGVTGIDLGEKLRAERPALGVILMSGYNNEILKGEAGRTAGVTLVAKPFEFANFAAVVRQKLGPATDGSKVGDGGGA